MQGSRWVTKLTLSKNNCHFIYLELSLPHWPHLDLNCIPTMICYQLLIIYNCFWCSCSFLQLLGSCLLTKPNQFFWGLYLLWCLQRKTHDVKLWAQSRLYLLWVIFWVSVPSCVEVRWSSRKTEILKHTGFLTPQAISLGNSELEGISKLYLSVRLSHSNLG